MMRELHLTVDQQSLGEEWAYVEAYCRHLRAELEEALMREDFADVEVFVGPERDSFNGGRLRFVGEWDNLSEQSFLRDLAHHLGNKVYQSNKWLPPNPGTPT
jgi:hypothetical protein